MLYPTKTWLSFAALACMATTAWAVPESVELKLQVNPQMFAQTRAAGYDALWTVVTETAAKHGMTGEMNPVAKVDEETELVYYYDTADKAFSAKKYQIRQKFKVKNGNKANRGTLMVKLRKATELTQAEIDAFVVGLDEEKEWKYEADTVGLADNEVGKLRTVYSVSAKQKKMRNGNGKKVEWLAKHFPVMGTVGVDGDAKISPVMDPVCAVETELGTVKFNGQKADMDVVTWYDESGKNLKLVELSWKYKTEKGDASMHTTLHNALQQRTDIFVEGKTKSGN